MTTYHELDFTFGQVTQIYMVQKSCRGMIGITLHIYCGNFSYSVVFLSVMPNASVTLLKNALSETTAIKSHTIVLQKNGDKSKES